MEKQEGGGMIPLHKSKQLYFFRRGDGETFAAQENEAYDLIYTNSGWRRQDIKFIGSSDGSTYDKVVNENKSKIQKLQMEQEDIREQMAAIDDKKSDEFIKLKVALRKKNEEINDISKGFVREAFNAELEKAKGNMIYPKNANIKTPAKDRDKIIREMGGRL